MTVSAFLDDRLIELGIDPSELSEPERVVLLSQLREAVNSVIRTIGIESTPIKVITEQNVREYQLLEDGIIQKITGVFIDGVDITSCRESHKRIFSSENRS